MVLLGGTPTAPQAHAPWRPYPCTVPQAWLAGAAPAAAADVNAMEEGVQIVLLLLGLDPVTAVSNAQRMGSLSPRHHCGGSSLLRDPVLPQTHNSHLAMTTHQCAVSPTWAETGARGAGLTSATANE